MSTTPEPVEPTVAAEAEETSLPAPQDAEEAAAEGQQPGIAGADDAPTADVASPPEAAPGVLGDAPAPPTSDALARDEAPAAQPFPPEASSSEAVSGEAVSVPATAEGPASQEPSPVAGDVAPEGFPPAATAAPDEVAPGDAAASAAEAPAEAAAPVTDAIAEGAAPAADATEEPAAAQAAPAAPAAAEAIAEAAGPVTDPTSEVAAPSVGAGGDVTAAPTAGEPDAATDEPATDQPAAPADDQPATESPALAPDQPAAPVGDEPAAPAAESAAPTADQPTGDQPTGDQPAAEGGKRRKKRKKGKGGGDDAADTGQPTADEATEQAEQQEQPKKRRGPEPAEVTARIGTTNDQALAYLANPDPKLSRLSRKVTEALLPDLHPVTAAALLGPAGFTRHLVASAATGRYRDLFVLWETFRRFPAEAKPELAERSIALAKAQEKLKTAVRIGLTGRSPRLAEDIGRAEGLIWTWLREALVAHLPAVGARPAVASALLRRDASIEVPLPPHPDDRWLAEAATARRDGELAGPVEALLSANVHRLPATVDTLRLATIHYPERVAALVDRVDLDAPDIGAFLAWARDHGAAERLHGRIRDRVAAAAARDRVDGLARWYAWKQRGVNLELPDALRTDSLEGFDLARPETAELAARLEARGIDLQLQQQLEDLAHKNRQLAEKAYEAMVCAGLGVTLPESLKDNPVVNPGTRCPKCQAWTWVRPGHEARCPRPEAGPAEEAPPGPFDFVAAEAGAADQT